MSSKRRKKPMSVREEAIRSHRVRETLEMRDRGAAFIITKHDQPVARFVPVVGEAGQKFIGRSAGMIVVRGDIVAPTSPDWEEGADI
jgi:antitoxin (DNA-binding transcriptional repressor) of toxin-antitoxin stability system